VQPNYRSAAEPLFWEWCWLERPVWSGISSDNADCAWRVLASCQISDALIDRVERMT
jgi:hypothetical protein